MEVGEGGGGAVSAAKSTVNRKTFFLIVERQLAKVTALNFPSIPPSTPPVSNCARP